ncbi:hypothetical protein [Helcococcus kunzii]
MINSYLTEVNTSIVKRSNVKGMTHIAPKVNIALDYKKYNIEREKIYINDTIVEDIYSSSLGYVLVSKVKPESSDITIKTIFEDRLNILRSMTSRLLIESVLDKYFRLKPVRFYTGIEKSSFNINGVYFDNDAREIIQLLERNINSYIKFDIKIFKDKDKNLTAIPGLIRKDFIDYTLSSINEINSFKIESYKFNNNGIEIVYILN